MFWVTGIAIGSTDIVHEIYYRYQIPVGWVTLAQIWSVSDYNKSFSPRKNERMMTIKLYLTCGEVELYYNVKRSHNILTKVVIFI